jgi:hypothetical protein
MAPAAVGQEAGLTDLYGNGVHAYFAGQPQQALETLTQAIDAGSQDPRVFYYRGLVWLAMNSPQAAEEDFARGAALEAGDAGGLFRVDWALERIQGRTRMIIERHRTAARLEALRRLGEERARYNQEIESARPEVTVPASPPPARPAVPLEAPVQPGAPPQPAPDQPAPNNAAPQDPLNAPQQNPPAKPQPDAKPAQPAPAQADPFKEDDPFAEKKQP